MSWAINIVGRAADVKAAVAKERLLPQPLKDMVALVADAAKPPMDCFQVQSTGNYDPNFGGSVTSFSMTVVTLADSNLRL